MLPASGSAKITSCSASNNQGGYNCNSAYDGVLTGTKGWAYSAQIPAWAIFNLEAQHTVAGLDLLSGVQRENHRLKKFKMTLKSNGNFIEPSNIKVTNAAGASISGATIEMQNCQDLLKVTFDPVAKVTAVRIDVYSTDASNNNVVLTEITVLKGSTTDVSMSIWKLALAANSPVQFKTSKSDTVMATVVVGDPGRTLDTLLLPVVRVCILCSLSWLLGTDLLCAHLSHALSCSATVCWMLQR